MEYLGEILSFACAVMWSVAVILFKQSGKYLGANQLNFFKNTFSVVLFAFSILIMRVDFTGGADTWSFLVLAFSGILGITIADTLFFLCLNKIGAILNSIVDCLYSPFIILISFFFFGDIINLTTIIGGIIIISSILLSSLEKQAFNISRKDLFIGLAYGTFSMLFMAIGLVIIKKPLFGHPSILETYDIFWVTGVRLFFASMAFFIYVPFLKNRKSYFVMFKPNKSWKVVMPAAFIGTYLSLIVWLAGWKYIKDVSVAAILNQLSIIFVMILAAIFLKEILTKRKVIAIISSFFGVSLVLINDNGETFIKLWNFIFI